MKIKIEGQEIELPDEIAGDDKMLKDALAPVYPSVANATIKRTGGVVEIVKQAGTKGNIGFTPAFRALVALPETLHPALVLAHGGPAAQAGVTEAQAEEIFTSGFASALETDATHRKLAALAPQTARQVPIGF